MAKLHEYPVSVSWKGGREGTGSVTDTTHSITNTLATPPEFGGTGEGTNPEQLLAMAVAACYSITFGIIATNRKLPLVDVKTEGVGEVEENGPSFKYTKVTLKPTITLEAPTEDQVKMAEDMAHKADNYCIITNAIRDKVAIEVVPNIVSA